MHVSSWRSQLLDALIVVGICLSILSPALATDNRTEIEGRIVEIQPSKREIYVQDSERKNEFYFNAQTKVVENGQEKSFSALQEGLRVKVTANKIGKRLDPIEVQILP